MEDQKKFHTHTPLEEGFTLQDFMQILKDTFANPEALKLANELAGEPKDGHR